jgi:hypothetical protein
MWRVNIEARITTGVGQHKTQQIFKEQPKHRDPAKAKWHPETEIFNYRRHRPRTSIQKLLLGLFFSLAAFGQALLCQIQAIYEGVGFRRQFYHFFFHTIPPERTPTLTVNALKITKLINQSINQSMEGVNQSIMDYAHSSQSHPYGSFPRKP